MKKAKTEAKKKTPLRSAAEWGLTLVLAVMIALPVRCFAFELVRVDGTSMASTLSDGEVLLVSRFDYASVWLSLPWQHGGEAEAAPRLVFGGDPERFDVVICRYPGRGDTLFVKRVVGLPGDTVELRSGVLYINGEAVPEDWVEEEYREGPRNDFGPCAVPDGEYFVLGDHRNASNDSRAQGTLSRDRIIGHVRTVLYPFSGVRKVQ